MKTSLPLLLLSIWIAFATPARAQITLPITGNVIVPTNAITAIYLTVITNVIVTNYIVTNVYITNLVVTPDVALVALTGNTIEPAMGKRLVKTVTGPTLLALLPFSETNWTTVYLQNPSRFGVVWPLTNTAGLAVNYRTAAGPSSPPGTNEDWPTVLFETVLGRLTGTQ